MFCCGNADGNFGFWCSGLTNYNILAHLMFVFFLFFFYFVLLWIEAVCMDGILKIIRRTHVIMNYPIIVIIRTHVIINVLKTKLYWLIRSVESSIGYKIGLVE